MATRYWFGGTGNWNNTNTANWSNTSGNSDLSAPQAAPVAGDTVIIDGNSGTGTISRTTAAVTIGSLDCTGYTGTLALGNFATNVDTGNVKFASGMTVTTGTGALTFTGGVTQQLTTNGKTIGPLTSATASNNVVLQDDCSCGVVTHTRGTIDLNGKTLTTSGNYSTTGTNTRVIAFGTGGVLALSGTATSFNIGAAGTSLTFSGTGLIRATGNGVTFTTGASVNLPAIEAVGVAGVFGPNATFDVASTVSSLYIASTNTGAGAINFTQGLTVSGDLTLLSCIPSNPIAFKSGSAGVARTVTVNGVVRIEGASITDITGAGGTWMAYGAAVDGGGNSGISFTVGNGRSSQPMLGMVQGV